MNPPMFKRVVPEFTVLPSESRDDEFTLSVVLVRMVQEGLYVTQQASHIIRGRAWGAPNHSRDEESESGSARFRGRPCSDTPTSCQNC